MFKKILAAALGLFVAVAFAASVDANKATQAELEAIKGVGPAIATKIMDERKKSAFKDWNDLVVRVKGVGEGNAAKLSADGLTVNGAAFQPTATAPAMKKDEMKADAKADKAAAKADAKMKKEEAKEEKAKMKADAKMKATPTAATPATPAMPASAAMPAKKTADAAPMTAKPASGAMMAAKPMAPKASEPMKK